MPEEPHGLAALEPQQVEQEVEPEEPTAEAEESVEAKPGIKPTQVEAEGGQPAVQPDDQVAEDAAELTDDSLATDAEPVVPAPPKAIPVFKPHHPATAPVQPAVARVVPDTEPAISQAPKAVGPRLLQLRCHQASLRADCPTSCAASWMKATSSLVNL